MRRGLKSALSPRVWGSVTTGGHQGVSLVLDMQRNWVHYFICIGRASGQVWAEIDRHEKHIWESYIKLLYSASVCVKRVIISKYYWLNFSFFWGTSANTFSFSLLICVTRSLHCYNSQRGSGGHPHARMLQKGQICLVISPLICNWTKWFVKLIN